jgi:hypothetical protein
MARKPLNIDCSGCCKVLLDVEQVVAGRKYLLFLQEASGVVLHWAAPKSIHLEERIRGLAVGVLWVVGLDKTTRFAVQNVIDDGPLACWPKPSGRVEPLGAL